MTSGKKYLRVFGYIYDGALKLKYSMRYRCSQGCGVYLYKSFDVTFALSQRGGRLLIFNGYCYSMQKFRNDYLHWRCTMVQPGTAKRCTAKLYTTIEYKVIEGIGGHCHKKPKFTKKNNTIIRIY
ncbi:uncharacterized protein LOC124535286 [Vanessa cardui]|uniref:uncharacterized protein LOC124535286 n=1 Tax=Vanessa cardui TaxID=171605 RepID=UPI001F13307C|nr:uncharacterized protein LOC124535286 [Vanessa cardui]